MFCPTCGEEGRKFGKDRHGHQRFQCPTCKKTFADRPAKPLDEMRLPLDKAVFVLKCLTEGNSVRATCRLTGVAKATVLNLLVCVGQKCEAFLDAKMREVKVRDVQADEIWGFVAMKSKTAKGKGLAEEESVGDAYCYCAIERNSKAILAWHLGKRDSLDTLIFVENVKNATAGRFQLTTDGWGAYPQAVAIHFEDRKLDYARLIKKYGTDSEGEKRYSPAAVIGVDMVPCCGNPDPKKICTSHIERQNLTIRMQNRRMTRLTNGFSKLWDNHRAALALHFAHYNFVRTHSTIKTTPAVKAGLADKPWSMLELLEAISTH